MNARPQSPLSPLALARAEIIELEPYSHASWEPELERLHANELPWRSRFDATHAGLNRYPEPQPRALVDGLAALYGVTPAEVLVGRGSDEAIDLLTRAFCRAGEDRVLICPPTFGMYAVAARIQGAGVVRVPLRDGARATDVSAVLEGPAASGRRAIGGPVFALDEQAILARCDERVKLVYVCTPNNPTGNAIDEAVLLRLAEALAGRALLVVDEAYIEFADARSMAAHVASHPFLAVIRTLSKAHGLAGARCGTLIAAPEIIALLRKIIPPYAMTQPTIETVLAALEPSELAAARQRVARIREERQRMAHALAALPCVVRVYPSDANFLLVEFHDAREAFARARDAKLLVRDVRSQPGLGRHLRISIGTPEQNGRLLEALARESA